MADTDKEMPIGALDNPAFVTSENDIDVTVKTNDVKKEIALKEIDTRFGYGSFKPQCLQWLNRIGVFVFWIFIYSFIEGFGVNGVADASIPALERQYKLSSSQSALIPASQDIGTLIVVLFVGFIGGRNNKPHWVSIGGLITAVGSLLFMVPHFAESYDYAGYQGGPLGICFMLPLALIPRLYGSEDCEGRTSGRTFLGVLFIANMLQGIGYSPMHTLGSVYIDDNAEHATASLLIGITYGASTLGVAFGLFVGGYILQNVFVDFDRVDQDSLGFDNTDARWVGAWWVAFIGTTIGYVLVALPIYGFPKHLPGNTKAAEIEEDYKKDEGIHIVTLTLRMLKKFFVTLLKLMKNPTYVLIKLGGISVALVVNGLGAFAFKLLYVQFNTDFDTLGILLGLIVMVGAVGTVLGGALIRIFKLELVGMLRLNMVACLVACLLGLSYFIKCPEDLLAGQEVPYANDTSVDGFMGNCNQQCDCDQLDFDFFPVCGADNVVYHSPCHAGCTFHPVIPRTTPFANCTCVASNLDIAAGFNATATLGRCDDGCDNIWKLAPFMFLMMLIILMTLTPGTMSTLRCVDEEDRPMAVGVAWVIVRLLGNIPGPLLLGAVIDRACLLWQEETCDSSSNCVLYSHTDIALYIMIWWMVTTGLGAVFFFAASIVAGRSTSKSVEITKM